VINKNNNEFQKLRTDIFKQRLKKREIWVNGCLADSLIEILYINLLELDQQSRELPITVVINSNGGSLQESIVATDIMGTINAPVKTIATANALSGGFILLMGGKERICHDYTNLMMHSAAFNTYGKVPGIKRRADYVDYHMKKMATFFANQTEGKTTQKYWLDLFESEQDKWFTIEEALKLGIVHRVIKRSTVPDIRELEPYVWRL
jgi:ATP-dependent Clp protease protease subunit